MVRVRSNRSIVLSAGVTMAITLVLAMAACEPSAPMPNEEFKPRLRIFFVGEGTNEPTWPVLQAAAARYQRDDPKNEIIAVTPEQNSPREQQELLVKLLSREPSAVCLLPCDPTALRSTINQLVTAGCPVVTIARDVPNSQRASYSGPTELEIGQQAAAACALALAHSAQTVMTINSEKKSDAYRLRGHAFRTELPTLGPIQILKQLDCGGDIYDAANRVRLESRNYPRTGCWVMFDDWPLRGISAKERLLPLGCRMVLCNGNPRYIDRVRKGEIQALVTFDFFESVNQAFMAARARADNPMIQLPLFNSVESMTISISELEWYERCWESWRRGLPSPPQKPWE